MGIVRDGVYYSKHKGDAIDNLLDKTVWQSNPNLLDNWYFVGGGSQQGGGKFPINQRGQTSYQPIEQDTYCIDRWYYGWLTTVEVHSGYIKLIPSDRDFATCNFQQKFENVNDLIGKTITISIMYESEVDFYFGPWNHVSSAAKTNGVSVVSITLQYQGDNIAIVKYDRENGAIKLYAMKAELGDKQTLAHQENGVWVLNEVPNYQEQLARCQRYQTLVFASTGQGYIGPLQSNGDTLAYGIIPTHVQLRAKPNFVVIGPNTIYSSFLQIWDKDAQQPNNPVTYMGAFSLQGNGIQVQVAFTTNLNAGYVGYVYRYNQDYNILLDANL